MQEAEGVGMLMQPASRADNEAEPMDRMTRGFHRIGLTLGVPFGLFGVIFVIGGFIENDSRTPTMFLGVCGLLFAIVWYGLCRATAWIVNGFRDSTPALRDSD